MNNIKASHIQEGSVNRSYWQLAGHLLFVFALIAASVCCSYSRPVPIEKPLILLAGSIFASFNFKKLPNICLLQKITLLYLVGMLFNQLSQQFTQISLCQASITIPISLIVLPLLAIGYVFRKINDTNTLIRHTNNLLSGWAVTFAVIIVHMIILSVFLKKFYGYGFEHNTGVLGSMCLYFLVFLFSWYQFENIRLRQITAAVLMILFLVLTVENRR